MIETPQDLRALLQTLSSSTWTLGAVAVLYETGLAAQLVEPRSVEELAAHCRALAPATIKRCLAVAASVGVVVEDGTRYQLAKGALAFAQPPASASLQGEMRATLMQVMAFLNGSQAAGPHRGWSHTDPVLLQAQGDSSAGLAAMLKANVVPMLGDLAQRLERPGARFLDVGVGVGALAIAMCRTWPQLHTVGLDPFDAPLQLARENVARAGLDDRIELRELAFEALRDESAFDLVWLPSFFIAPEVLPAAIARAHAALRPGGFVLLPVLGSAGQDAPQRAVLALINELWGGPVLTTTDAEARLQAAGFTAVRTLPGPPWAPGFVVAQR